MEKEYSGFYKDFLEGRAYLTSSGNVFNNSKCLFCEFNDIITPTWYAIIDHIIKAHPKSLENLVDTSYLETLSSEDRIRWYATRKHRNALLDIKKEEVSDIDINIITSELFATDIAYYNEHNQPYIMNYAYTLTKALRAASVIIDKFVIYVEQCNEVVDKFITYLYNDKVEVRSGNLVGALRDISFDSTFVFSDIYKVNALKEAGILQGSSILLADGYGYNYKENGRVGYDEDLIIDLDNMSVEVGFTFNLFNNFTD